MNLYLNTFQSSSDLEKENKKIENLWNKQTWFTWGYKVIILVKVIFSVMILFSGWTSFRFCSRSGSTCVYYATLLRYIMQQCSVHFVTTIEPIIDIWVHLYWSDGPLMFGGIQKKIKTELHLFVDLLFINIIP